MATACYVCGAPLRSDYSLRVGRCHNCRLEAEREIVMGVGKDAPTAVNEHGGKQSHSPYRADLLPPHAMLAVSAVLAEGAAKYGERNWHAISAADNLNHAMVHLLAMQAGDTSDEHLEHAATRILFALDQVRSGREAKLQAAAKGLRSEQIYKPDELAAFATAFAFRKGDRVIVYGKLPGVIREDYTGGEYVRVTIDGEDHDCGFWPRNVCHAGHKKGGGA